ncbi:MAG: type III secretion system chaperone [Dongiaceae bacterium]
MSDLDAVQQVIGEFGKSIGIDDLALDAEGYCCLAIDHDLIVNIELDATDGQLVLYSVVGQPGPDRAAVLETLMQANYLGQGTRGAILGLQPGTGAVVLSRALPADRLDLPAFNGALERFVNTAEDWMRRLAGPAAAADPAAEAAAPAAPDFPIPPGLRA